MRIDLSQKLQMRTELRLAPQMIQAIEILQIPVAELRERIDQELEINPVLEIDERPSDLSSRGESSAESTPQSNSPTPEELKREEKFDAMDRFFEEDFARPSRHNAGERDKKLEAMANREAHAATIQDHLLEQLNFLEQEAPQRKLCEYIINNIGKSGYILYSLDELIDALKDEYPANEVKDSLETVRSLDPPGVGAFDIQDCLLLQIDRICPGRDLERELVSEYLVDIEYNRYPKIAKATGRDLETIKEAIAFVASLNPRPGSAFGREDPQYIVPDVIVEDIDGRYEIRLENSYIPPLRVSTGSYQSVTKGSEAYDFLKRKQESARWLIESIHQRQNTLQKICHEVFRIQKDFLDKGPNFLHPLRMQEVADNVGVHISTVSRAIANKYAQTPRGIFSLRSFFTGATKSLDGQATESQESVRQKLQEMISNEDKRYPLSDEDIRTKFREQGIDIARRTITKYRKALSIPSTRQRRQY